MINRDYLYTKRYINANDFSLIDNSVYIYSKSPEERSFCTIDVLKRKCQNIKYLEIEYNEDDSIVANGANTKHYLRDSISMCSLLEMYNLPVIYIDTSGLNARISASLLRNAVLIAEKRKIEINIIYTEPNTYKVDLFNSHGFFQHISEKIGGIEPLPGFASIIPNTEKIKFVALLGFEGGRFTYITEQIQLPKDSITPVVGVPGFRIEYPFVALLGNKLPLEETESWNNIEYAAANSIVDAFFLLKKILKKPPIDYKLIIAPIGTKPHVIAAILLAIKFPEQVEIIYDNPERKNKRTEGTGLINVCNINSLLGED